MSRASEAKTEVPWTIVNPNGGEKMFLLENHTYLEDRRRRTGKKSHVAATASTADFHVLLSEDFRVSNAGAGQKAAGRRIQKCASDEEWVVV
jgi:hypothetical protein